MEETCEQKFVGKEAQLQQEEAEDEKTLVAAIDKSRGWLARMYTRRENETVANATDGTVIQNLSLPASSFSPSPTLRHAPPL